MKPALRVTKNGLHTIIVDTKAFPSITTLLLVGAGSRYENKKNNGVAHFFEHMAFKGSKKYPTSMVLSSTIEGLGGIFNAFTAKDHTGYWIKAPSRHFVTVIDVIADMIQQPNLLEEEIDREKGVIVEEINMYEDTPYRRVGEYFEQLLYQGNSLGLDIGGSKETVTRFARNTFIDYMDTLYHPKNSVLVIAGGLNNSGQSKIDVDYYFDLVENKFGGWKNGKKAGFENVVERQEKPQLIIKPKKTEQAHFCIGFRAFSRLDERRYALSVLAALLGGGMSSRLFHEVRERRGLCYYISTAKELYQDVGILLTQAGVPIIADKVKEAVSVTLKEHKKIVKGEVTAEELVRAKELIKGRFILSLEDSSSVANRFGGEMLFEDTITDVKKVLSKIDAVNLSDIVAIAFELFVPQRLNMAMIGPFEKKDEFEEVLYI